MCVPEKILTNADIEKLVDTTDEWIFSRTGIRERRIAVEGESTGDFATGAAREAMSMAGLNPEDVDLLLVATCTGDTNADRNTSALVNLGTDPSPKRLQVTWHT